MFLSCRLKFYINLNLLHIRCKCHHLNQLHFYSEDENIKKGIVKEWTEKFQDPPYNTMLLPQPVPDTEQELKNWLNNA